MLQAIIVVVVQIIVLLAVSPFIVGLIRKVKARLQLRRGASVFQPYMDIAKLFRKDARLLRQAQGALLVGAPEQEPWTPSR